jgi:hypothetical protein
MAIRKPQPVSLSNSPLSTIERSPTPVPGAADPGIYTPPLQPRIPNVRAPAPVASPYRSQVEPLGPVTRAASPVANQIDSTSSNTIVYRQAFITVAEDGNTVLPRTAQLNFTGPGVTVTASQNVANISIQGSESVYGNANVAAYLPTYTGTITASTVTASGNITANYFVGNGSQLTGISANYGNANVAANLAAFGSNPITTTGNITAGYFIGNGSQLTGISANYGNANVVSLLANFGSNTITTTGNITAGNVVGTGSGTPTITSTGNLTLSAVTGVQVSGGGTFRLPSLTSSEISALTAVNGDIVYNSTSNRIQGYSNGAWVNIT